MATKKVTAPSASVDMLAAKVTHLLRATFDFLGVTVYWRRSDSGRFALGRKTRERYRM